MPADGTPLPRDRHVLFGQDEPAGALRAAASAGRLHHAWLLGGPEGVGKATLAYRFARWLLAPESERIVGGDGLAVDPQGRTARQVSAGSHPNLVVLERLAPDGGKAPPRTISVDTVRRSLAFFGTTSADGGHRICIVDPVEDLTLNGANALLKTVEEPPAGALILLVSHRPQQVLPTIRSRCRKLALSALRPDDVERALATLGGAMVDGPARAKAAATADGSVGQAVALLEPKRLALLDEIGALLAELPHVPTRKVLALADKLADRRAEAEFPLALDAVQRWLGARVAAGQGGGVRRLAPLAEACEKILDDARSVEVYNLDRRPFILSMFEDLAAAARRSS